MINKDGLGRISNAYNAEINFEIFNPKHFKNDEFNVFKELFYEWAENSG